jgi:hypothetical protein
MVTNIAHMLLALMVGVIGLLLAAPVLVLGLPFYVVALLTRAMAPLWEPAVVPWEGLIEFHPTIGWKPKPHFSGHCLEERGDIFHVTTDQDGWPGLNTIGASELVVFGDSYAFGYGIDDRLAFYRANPGLPIKAIGAPGYNMVQEVLLMEQLAGDLRGKYVVWFIYLGNDLYDNVSPEMSGYRIPFACYREKTGTWDIVTDHVCADKWLHSQGRQSRFRRQIAEEFYHHGFMSERAYSACEFLISKGLQICDRQGADLAVVTIPSPLHYLLNSVQTQGPAMTGMNPCYPDDKLGGICAKLGVEFMPLKDHLVRSDYKERDDHWNEKGHRRVAKALKDLYEGHRTR